MWLFDFLHYFMENLYNERSMKLSDVASHAYKKGLGPHHPWMIRQAAKVAMIAVPPRDTFLNDTKATYEDILEFKTQLEKVRPYLWDYYRAHKLDQLP